MPFRGSFSATLPPCRAVTFIPPGWTLQRQPANYAADLPAPPAFSSRRLIEPTFHPHATVIVRQHFVMLWSVLTRVNNLVLIHTVWIHRSGSRSRVKR